MPREPHHRYIDPLDHVWIATAEAVGLRITRSRDVFASTDGTGTLAIGSPETLDPDDCLAQMIFHELCHSLVEGPASLGEPDWGLHNVDDRDAHREWACLRAQAALAAPHGLRRFLAPTTEHRAFYDQLGPDPLADGDDASLALARTAVARAGSPPWAPHLERALAATATVVRRVAEFSVSAPAGELPALYEVVDGDAGE